MQNAELKIQNAETGHNASACQSALYAIECAPVSTGVITPVKDGVAILATRVMSADRSAVRFCALRPFPALALLKVAPTPDLGARSAASTHLFPLVSTIVRPALVQTDE